MIRLLPVEQRVCRCQRCSDNPQGFLSVTYTTWTRHNPPKVPVPPPSQQRERSPLSPLNCSPNIPFAIPDRNDFGGSDTDDEPAAFGEAYASSSDGNEVIAEAIEGTQEDYEYGDQMCDEDLEDEEMPLDDGGQPVLDWWGEEEERPRSESPRDPDPVPIDRARRESTFEDSNYDDDEDESGDELLSFPLNCPRYEAEDLVRHHLLEPPIRHLFTTVALGKATGMSFALANLNLDHMSTALELATGDDLDGRTSQVKTALSRIGVNPDDRITRYIVCPHPHCWNLVPYKELYNLASPLCTAERDGEPCSERMYRTLNHIRTPIKVMPYSKLSDFLGKLLQDRTVRERINEWRIDGEDTEHQADPDLRPVPSIFEPFLPVDQPLQGLSHGVAWRAYATNTQRLHGDGYPVEDAQIPGCSKTRHSGMTYGLKIILGCDR
jgi:hypothetical protein